MRTDRLSATTSTDSSAVNPTAPVTGSRRDRLQHRRLLRRRHDRLGHGADIHGANYYGVVVERGRRERDGLKIHDIGETPLNGAQHGVGVFYTTLNPDLSSTERQRPGRSAATSSRSYQKGGIVVNGPGAAVTISGNTVTGEGRVNYIAQNGIQVGRGATGTITGNTVTGNAYTGANNASSSGILLIGGYATARSRPASRSPTTRSSTTTWASTSTTPTRADPALDQDQELHRQQHDQQRRATNISGNGSGGYQVGIYDFGNKDNIVNNKISGTATTRRAGGSFFDKLDLTGSTKPHFNNNG